MTSHGLLGFGGLVCFALGASALFTQPVDPFEPLARVAPPVIVTVTVTAGIFLALIVYAAVRSRGMASPLGMVGSAMLPAGVTGSSAGRSSRSDSIHAAGEEWTARSANDRPIERGTPVKVVAVDGLTVLVEPDPIPSQA